MNSIGGAGWVVLMVLVLGVGLFFSCVGCEAGEMGREALQKAGYTDIKLGGSNKMACDSSDTLSNEFTAKLNGRPVRGVVCCGVVFKGCTIRH